jgi:hypothetical protein
MTGKVSSVRPGADIQPQNTPTTTTTPIPQERDQTICGLLGLAEVR